MASSVWPRSRRRFARSETALVLDGNTKQALAIVRSLGARGVSVHVGAERGTGLALHSRYSTERFTYPSPKEDQGAFIEAVRAQAARMDAVPIVYACSDATVCTLYAYRADLEGVVELGLPSDDAFENAFDKAATYSEARVNGVPAITTYLRERSAEVEPLARELTFPVVLKPRRSVTWKDGVGIFGTASFITGPQELRERFIDHLNTTGDAPIIQPFVAGEEYGVEVLARDGAAADHHRVRSMSPTGGASVVKETLEDGELSRTLHDHARTLVGALSWTGPMMVEFKVDTDSRAPLLVEINGRWWGSLPLAIAAGVDFPQLHYTMMTGGTLPENVVRSRSGVTTRYFLGDVRHLLRVLFARDPMRGVRYPTRRKAFRDFFRSFRHTQSDVWSWRDPIPSIMQYIDIVAKLFIRS